MKLVVFGSTGGTGKNAVARALALGHTVTAVARRPDAVPARERLTVHTGDVLDAASLAGAFAGADAVIVAIGPASNRNPGTLISVGTANVLAGCAQAGVKRLVFESGLMMSDGKELALTSRLGVAFFRTLFPRLHADKVVAEAALRASALEWVIVRPPALTDGVAVGGYVLGANARVSAARSMTHADCADALVRAATEPQWARQVLNVGRA